MASAAIHLAIAKKYLERHPGLDKKEILRGTLYLDAASDNDKSHYTRKNRGFDNVSHVRSKVDLYAFLLNNKVCTSFEVG